MRSSASAASRSLGGHLKVSDVDQSTDSAASSDPRRYFEQVGDQLGATVDKEPVCLYLETTNRCNLLCTTCPRTFEALEPPADMSWELFTSIVDQFPKIARVVLHGVGEPMMVRDLPRMIRYLKDRGTFVLFNTNGTLLTRKRGIELIDAGLDELRVSLDAAEPKAFALVRGRDMFDRIVRNLQQFTALQRELHADTPKVSLWLTGLKETIDQLPAFVRLAHELGISEVYLQRLVYFEGGLGLARSESSLFERTDGSEAQAICEAEKLAADLGLSFNASGATEPGTSLKKREADQPWSLCRRPWTLMYFTAHGRAIPCCIAPFSMRGYDSFTLGNATQQSLREIWNGERYQDFRRALLSSEPPKACANCGLRWSL
jgi:MoaA/NifB/PqqE/SkfB family radical SAM enzyme